MVNLDPSRRPEDDDKRTDREKVLDHLTIAVLVLSLAILLLVLALVVSAVR